MCAFFIIYFRYIFLLNYIICLYCSSLNFTFEYFSNFDVFILLIFFFFFLYNLGLSYCLILFSTKNLLSSICELLKNSLNYFCTIIVQPYKYIHMQMPYIELKKVYRCVILLHNFTIELYIYTY